MANILIIYSTTDGHTLKICHRLRQVIAWQGHDITIVSVEECEDADLPLFDKIVIGASIRYGRHSPRLIRFVNRNEHILDSKPNAFFSVNVVARKPEKNQPDSNPYFKKFLKNVGWRPKKSAVFAGKIDYPRYHLFDRFMIRLIMWMTSGPTDPLTVVEFTDWGQVEDFGHLIGEM